ncbi:Ionotropic glutamate receptor [Sergentomyia squamirostris]
MDSVIFLAVIRAILQALNCPLRITGQVYCSQPVEHFKVYKNLTTFSEDSVPFFSDTLSGGDYHNLEEHHTVILLDYDCPKVLDILGNASQSIYLNYKWILFNSNPEKDFQWKLDSFEDLPIFSSSEIFILISDDENITVKQVYRHFLESKVKEEVFGIYQVEERIFEDQRKTGITSRRRQNVDRGLLRASLVITHNDSLNHLTDYRDKHIDTITKVNYILTNHLIDYVNGTVEYSIVPTWGYLNGSTWSGMIGELHRNLVQLGASPLFYTIDRIPVIQYVAMTTPTRSKFVFRSPKLSFTDNVFILPFNTLVWYSLIALMIVLILFLTLATAIEWKASAIDSQDSLTLRPKISEAFILVFGASCQQGCAQTPRGFSTRSITLLTFVALMFLYTSYSANIVALLQSPSNKIKTLNDLLSSRLKFGVDDTVFNRYYFTHQTENTRKAIYEQKILQKGSNPAFMPLEQGIKLLRQGLFAFHMETGVGYKVVTETFFESEKCDLQEIQFYELIDPWYAIQRIPPSRKSSRWAYFECKNMVYKNEKTPYFTRKNPDVKVLAEISSP